MQPKDGVSSSEWHDRDGPNWYQHYRPKNQMRVFSLKPVGPENRNSRISCSISRYQSPPIPDSVSPQLSISVIVTGGGNPPPEMSMRSRLLFLAGLFATTLRPRRSLQIEIVALRHQLPICQRTGRRPLCQRTGRRPLIVPADRILWARLARAWSGWRNHLFFVKPSTVIAWQRRCFRDHWRSSSRPPSPLAPAPDFEGCGLSLWSGYCRGLRPWRPWP